MTMKSFGLVCGVFLLMMTGAVDATSQELPKEVTGAMSKFLDAWLVQHDEDETLSYISESIRSQEVAPRSVWVHRNGEPGLSQKQKKAYWNILNKRGSSPERRDSLESALVNPDPDLVRLLRYQGDVFVQPDPEPFLVIAGTDVVINGFDAGYGDVTKALGPAENDVWTMVADYTGRQREDTGPFVSFWIEEADGWRLQTLGAIPHDVAWLDNGIDDGIDRDMGVSLGR